MRLKAFFAIFAVVALLLSFGATLDEARADAIMFPYVVTSDTVASIVSVVNHTAAANKLHLAYFYKKTVDNSNTDCCHEINFEVPTTPEDIVSFEVNGSVGGANGGPLFNDATNYGGASFAMNIVKPRRAFLLVDNRIDGGADNLYGEVMIVELTQGAAWGYRAYNSTDTDWLNPYFRNADEIQGEVLDDLEYTPTTLLPPDDWVTRFFVTPVGIAGGGQDYEGYNAVFRLYGVDEQDNQIIAMWDRDENPVSGAIPKNIVCVGALDLAANVLLTEGSYNRIKAQGGWTFADVNPGTLGGSCEPGRSIYAVDEATVMKLEYNLSNSIDGHVLPGYVNTMVWLRDNGTGLGIDGVDPLY